MRWIYFMAPCVFICSCSSSRVVVDRYPVLKEDLPSYYIESPDPALQNPLIGQILVCRYQIRAFDPKSVPYLLMLRVIYKNLDEETHSVALYSSNGAIEFKILGEKYEATGGALTYRADLMTEDGAVVADFKHRLWFEIIQF